MSKLNAARMRTLTKSGTYGDGAGLYLQVRGPNKRSWLYRFKLHGKAHLMGLGTVDDVSLAEARDAAGAARKLVRQGTNPIDRRRAARAENATQAGMTFGQVADAYIAAHEPSWRNPKHRQQWRNTLGTYVAPFFGKLPVAQVGVDEVIRVLEPMWREKTETASRLRGRIESVLDYATARGWRSGENPARWRGHLDNLLPARSKVAKVEHHSALPWREVGAFTTALANEEGVSALALRFAILTAARTGEVIGARWSEIDMQAATWTIPAERMKAAREHRVPRSDGALSTADQTVSNQRVELEAAAAARGWTVVATYADEGISGAKTRDGRPQLDLMLKDAVRRKFDVVMVWAVDRLGRSLPDLIASMQELHGAKVDLFIHQQGLDTTTASGRAMFGMLGVFSEFERAMIQSRVKAGLQRAQAEQAAGKVRRDAQGRRLKANGRRYPARRNRPSGSTWRLVLGS